MIPQRMDCFRCRLPPASLDGLESGFGLIIGDGIKSNCPSCATMNSFDKVGFQPAIHLPNWIGLAPMPTPALPLPWPQETRLFPHKPLPAFEEALDSCRLPIDWLFQP